MPGRGTVDVVFVLKRLNEKVRAKNKQFFTFVDLEKAFDKTFDWVPREGIHFALMQKGGPGYLVNGVMFFYKGCKTTGSIDGEL